MARPAVPELNLNGTETASVCSDLDSGIGSCSPTSTGPACVPEHKSVQTFRSTEDYLYAMKEDLAEWLNCLYDQEMHVDNFFEKLENGVLLCDHANHVQMLADEYRDDDPNRDRIPEKAPVYRKNVKKGTFQARDNICNFISWCKQLGVPDVILFETEDLVMRKNEKSVVLALLEVARKGAKFGMLVPCLIQLEQEIDAEIKGSPPPVKKEPPVPMVQTITCDMRSLDEMVRDLVSQCVCLPNQFPLIRLAEGKYQVGENKTLIFVRILRNHVMVRVGGGWDTLENYLNKHDPCRCSKPVTRKTSFTRPRVVSSVGPAKEGKPNVQEPKASTPNTPQQSRRSVTESAQSVPTRRISTPERPRPSTANPQTSTGTARRRLSLDSGGDNSTSSRSTPERSGIARSPSTEMTNPNNRSTSNERTIPQPQRSASKDRLNPKQAWAQSSPKQRSPISPERSLARSLAGSLSDIRQQSELLRQQLQEDFSDDSSMSSDISRVSEPQMSKSLDFSKVRDARRASAPSKESTPPAKSVTRRSQTPQQTPPQRDQLIRRSMTPQPQSSSRVRSTPTTPVARRREVPRNASTPDRNQQSQQQPRSKTPSGAMTATLKERLNKYKQETSTLQRQQQRQHQQQQQQQAPRARRDSDKPVIRRDSASKTRSQSCQPGLAGARYKSTSLSALDTQLNLDEIEDIGGNEEMYMEMEKMFQEFKKQEIEKTEKQEARMSIEAELDRRINGQVSDKKTSLREHFSQKGGRAPGGTKTAPNTPGIQRRSSASASPSSWRENSDQIIRRGPTPKRSKTPDPVVSHDLTDSPHDPVKMCKCCSKLSELLESAPVEVKPRKDDDESRPKTRIPAPATSRSLSAFRRTNSMASLASSTDESESSDLSKTDNEIRAINKDVLSPRSRRMSAPTGEPNKMMAPLITNRSTIMKDVPRAMSPVKALREQRPASPIKAFRRQESS